MHFGQPRFHLGLYFGQLFVAGVAVFPELDLQLRNALPEKGDLIILCWLRPRYCSSALDAAAVRRQPMDDGVREHWPSLVRATVVAARPVEAHAPHDVTNLRIGELRRGQEVVHKQHPRCRPPRTGVTGIPMNVSRGHDERLELKINKVTS